MAFLLIYLVARFWGSLLPYLADFGIAADDRAGMRTALLYFANILGSVAGSIVTGFVLTDRLGLVAIAAALVVASLACAALFASTLPLPRPEKLLFTSFAAGLALLALAAIPRWSAAVLDALQWKGGPQAQPLVDVVENRSGIITVAADGTVFGNGMYDGHFNTELKHDATASCGPMRSAFPSGAARRADDRPVFRLMGAGYRQQSGCRLAHRRRDQSGLSL